MSRDQELSKDYMELSKMAEKEPKQDAVAVEWDWYLFEQEGQIPVVNSLQHLADYNYDLKKMRNLGWIATPITLIRKR